MKNKMKRDEYIKMMPHNWFFGNFVDSDGELIYLKDFADSTVKLLRNAASDTNIKKRKVDEAILAVAGDVEYLYGELYPSDVNQAIVIASIIFLEREIRTFSRNLRIALDLELGLGDISGSLLERFQKYFEKVANMEFKLDDSVWKNIKGIFEIRNCLVHCSGNLDEFSRKSLVIEFAERHGTPIIEDSWIRIKEETVNLVLKVIRDFVESIYESALERFPKENDRLPSREE